MIKNKFIHELEGCSLTGYVPAPKNSNSGVTIATGYDIGQRYTTEIINAFNEELARKLTPYAGLTKQEAVGFLEKNPLQITEEEANEITAWSDENVKRLVIKRWNASNADILFEDLSDERQTVLASVAYQYGNLASKTPKFYGHATCGDWPAAIAELRNFGDATPTRHNREADILEDGFSVSDVGGGVPPDPKPKPQ